MTDVAERFASGSGSAALDGVGSGRTADTATRLHGRARLPLTDGDGKLLPVWRRRRPAARRAAWHSQQLEAADGAAARVLVAWSWIRSELKHLPDGVAEEAHGLVSEVLVDVREELARRFPDAVASSEEAGDDGDV